MRVTTVFFAILGLVGGLALGAASCGPPPIGDCRFDPNCGSGGIGAYCGRDSDCFDNHCCKKDECDGGMCSFECDNDGQCPRGMLCEHKTCFFVCGANGECGPGQECKHGGRVCEWD